MAPIPIVNALTIDVEAKAKERAVLALKAIVSHFEPFGKAQGKLSEKSLI